MPTSSSDHPSHLQVLSSFLTGSWTDFFGYVSIIEAPTIFLATSVTMAITSFFPPKQARKSLILPGDFFVGWRQHIFLHLLQCRHTVCRKLICQTYTTAQALPTTKRVELFYAKEFATTTLVDHDKAFVAWSQGSRIPLSRSLPIIRTISTTFLPTLLRSYLSASTSMIIPSIWPSKSPICLSILWYYLSVEW